MTQNLHIRDLRSLHVRWWRYSLFLSLFVVESVEAGCEKFLAKFDVASRHQSLDHGSFVPLGVSIDDFRDFLEFLKDDPIFADAESIVIYGSRTNHQEGLRPQSNSDLDLRILWRSESLGADLNLMNELERVRKVNEALEPWSKRLGFKVAIEIPSFSSLREFVLELHPMFRAIRDLEESKEVQEIETEEDRLSAKIKTSEILTRHRLSINPGAIFIIKSQMQGAWMQERLRALGIRKIIHLN